MTGPGERPQGTSTLGPLTQLTNGNSEKGGALPFLSFLGRSCHDLPAERDTGSERSGYLLGAPELAGSGVVASGVFPAPA